eukprot:SAG22_NODE_4285_length_1317_cov_1.371100_1_plen_50_part_00
MLDKTAERIWDRCAAGAGIRREAGMQQSRRERQSRGSKGRGGRAAAAGR